MKDKIQRFRHSLIQHGPLSQRIYLMKLSEKDVPGILSVLAALASEKGYTKIFAKIPQPFEDLFKVKGYVREAFIPHFFKGSRDGVFMSLFLSKERKVEKNKAAIRDIVDGAKRAARKEKPRTEAKTFLAKPQDAKEMSALYKKVFPSYPFPITDPCYLRETMERNIWYFGVREKNKIVALSSAEIDFQNRNVEMTDFATLPPHRGRGFAVSLLGRMEDAMIQGGMQTAYTIARALSPVINRAFGRMGYAFGGTLVNNTHIAGRIESMNIWYKNLRPR